MKNDFICPKCHGHLVVSDHIILTAKTKKWIGGIILLGACTKTGEFHKMIYL